MSVTKNIIGLSSLKANAVSITIEQGEARVVAGSVVACLATSGHASSDFDRGGARVGYWEQVLQERNREEPSKAKADSVHRDSVDLIGQRCAMGDSVMMFDLEEGVERSKRVAVV